mmetsp:Transcript_9243/g.17327  ORF Transcript_9243/g.17327 Transcript_9243/m.17327 type:complete len:277 (-) Transcript_9243:171-1001(-)|eukprot:CAMPEP_0175074782 /NCGR_PEP_ID=MMETSP0052_2-20121109/21536_1 /TAXON_ID=51329 ORGANISM="Polytomella parva, Strain SAG 63-3" /NCGR_SAMPLE_ID=MMETSP0052_2 /ASSEMBLY_ACC=CAM_ASM_000194 /LENGTH=276 /DNA_ID=CAMNT_0016343195 /DNA_START=236 /DNA_END=1066 /DNA_ORIENTATION=-
MSRFYDYNWALTRAVPNTFEDSLKLEPPPIPINLQLAKQQHENYTSLISSLVSHSEELPCDSLCPDCVFIEDTAVIIGNIAVITIPGAPERQPETKPIQKRLEMLPGLSIHLLTAPAKLDGGDVLFTGSCIFVGLSKRTNEEAVRQMETIFKGIFPVLSLPVTGHTLHLKSVISALNEDVILAAEHPLTNELKTKIDQCTPTEILSKMKWIFVPQLPPSNALRIGNAIIMQEGFPESEAIIHQYCVDNNLKLHKLEMSEFLKADGALTCCSLLFKL